MPKLFLVRHAEPVLRGVLLGRLDPSLSPVGVECARTQLAALPAAVAYSSPLARALETARFIPAPELVVLDDLAEIGLGDWEGLSWAEIERRQPLTAQRKLGDWLAITPPGGESWQSLERRVDRVLARIARGPFPAALVGHVAVNSAIAQRLAGIDPLGFNQSYCEVLEYDFPPDIAHLDPWAT